MLEQDKCRNNPCHLSQIPESRWGETAAACRAAFSCCPNLSLATRHWRGDWTSVPVVAIATGSSPPQKPPPFAVYVFLCFSSSPFFVFLQYSCCFSFLIFPLFCWFYVLIRKHNGGRDEINIRRMVSKGRFNWLKWDCREQYEDAAILKGHRQKWRVISMCDSDFYVQIIFY